MRETVVLVVDDETEIEDMLNTILMRSGFRTASFSDPLSALHFFEENQAIIDLVITDFNMPEMRGSDFAGRLAEINPGVPVIVITGYMDMLRGANCPENIKIVLEKPAPREILIQSVESLVNR